MTTSCLSFPGPAEAAEAVERLRAAGVPDGDVRILMGARTHDRVPSRRARTAGSLSRPKPPSDGSRASPCGATRRWAHSPGTRDEQPTGTFATIDRETVTIPRGAMREVRDVGHRRLPGLLMEAGVEAEAAEREVRALHSGRVLVLVRAGEDVAAVLSAPPA